MNEHDIVAEWLQVAYDDYDTALYLAQKPHRKPLEIICYHCQQSVEKSLKAFLCANGVEIPRTHETGVLCQQCADIDDSFTKYLAPCEDLAIYATETRYPIRIEIDEATAKRNLEQAQEIYSFVTGIISLPILDINICKLTPELAEDYVGFFDITPHDDNIDEHKCYCVCWSNDDYEGKDFSTREKRREFAIQYVQNGNIQGYLAYRGDDIVGWCNANTKSDCLKCCSWRTFMDAVPTEESESGVRIKSVFCFTVTPDMKRKGIAKQMLGRVCQDAALDGFDFVEAYPRKEPVDENTNFRGAIELYKSNGFTIHYESDKLLVMRKRLK